MKNRKRVVEPHSRSRRHTQEFWSQRELRDNRKGKDLLKIARGSVGRSLRQKTLDFAKERLKAKEHKKNQESDSSPRSGNQRKQESNRRYGCLSERKGFYKKKWTKCEALRRLTEERENSQCRRKDHIGEPLKSARQESRSPPQRAITIKRGYDQTKDK